MKPVGQVLIAGIVATAVFADSAPSVSGTIRQTIDEDSNPRGFHMVLQAKDADSGSVEWDIAQPAEHGEAGVLGRGKSKIITYTPEQDWNGEDRFTLSIDDGFGGRSELEIVVTVRPRNDAPRNRLAPRLNGVPAIGEELGVDPGEWDDARDSDQADFRFTYQWQTSPSPDATEAVDLEESNGDRLLLDTSLDGQYVRAVVTATEIGEEPLTARAATAFFKVGNAMPEFVLVSPLHTMPAHHPIPSEATVEVDRIVFKGNDSISSEELAPLVSRFTGRRVTLTELKYAAEEVTAEYRRRGMILAKAYLPPQEVADGEVQMEVLEGRRGEVTVEGNTRYSEEFVRGHLEEAMTGEVVSNRELESGLLMMNEEYPGLRVQAVLQPGQAPGTVGILAVVEEEKPWNIRLGYNNHGSDSVSQHRFVLGAEASHLAVDGDRFSLEGVFAEHPEDLANGSFRYEYPLNFSGTKVGAQAAAGFFEVGKRFKDLGIQGDSESAGLFVKHPLMKSRELRLMGELGLYAENANFEILDETVSKDRVRTAYVSLYASGTHAGGSTTALVNLTQGLSQFAGGMPEDSELASREGGDNKFTRLTASLARRQNLTPYAALFVRLSGQVSNETLLASQEWQIGGADSVRGYAPAEAVGDEGMNATAEVQFFPFKGLPHQLVGFVDYGYASRDATLVAEPEETDLTGAGFGLRYFIQYPYVDGFLRFDVGWPIGSEENASEEDPVLYFSTELKF